MEQDPEQGATAAEYLDMIRRNWILSLISFLIIGGIAAGYLSIAPRYYESSSRVLLLSPDQTYEVLGLSQQRIDIETEREIILSSSILGPVSEEYPSIQFTVFAKDIKDTSVIEITVESTDPKASMEIARAVAEQYINFTSDLKRQSAASVNDFISRQIASLKADLDALNKEMVTYRLLGESISPQQQFSYETLLQSYEAKDELYSYLLSKREELSIAAQEQARTARIIQYPIYPNEPSRPNFLLISLLGLTFAIIGSVIIVYLQEQLSSIAKEADIVNTFRAPVLGSAQRSLHTSHDMLKPLQRIYLFFRNPKKYMEERKDEKGKIHVLTPIELRDEKNSFARSLHIIITNLQALRKDSDIRSVAVTSPNDREGKSMISANMGVMLAHHGSSVLLVDANLRTPVLHKSFKPKKADTGFPEVLSGSIKAEAAIQKTNYSNLDVLLSARQGTASAISPNRVRDFLASSAAARYDYVIIDTSSLKHPESLAIASESDSTVVVLTSDAHEKSSLAAAHNSLKKARAGIMGAILNRYVR